MKTKTYVLKVDAECVKEYTPEEFASFEKAAAEVYEDPAEYLGHVVVLPATTEDGREVVVGIN